MATIYIVTSGTYSDYHIDAVFDSADKTQAFIAYQERVEHDVSGDTYTIESWELNAHYSHIQRGMTNYRVTFPDATIGDATAEEIAATCDPVEQAHLMRTTGLRYYQVQLWAKDAAAALKIANERRVAYLLAQDQQAEGDDA